MLLASHLALLWNRGWEPLGNGLRMTDHQSHYKGDFGIRDLSYLKFGIRDFKVKCGRYSPGIESLLGMQDAKHNHRGYGIEQRFGSGWGIKETLILRALTLVQRLYCLFNLAPRLSILTRKGAAWKESFKTLLVCTSYVNRHLFCWGITTEESCPKTRASICRYSLFWVIFYWKLYSTQPFSFISLTKAFTSQNQVHNICLDIP